MKQSQRMINALARSQRPFTNMKAFKVNERVICFSPLVNECGSNDGFFARYQWSDWYGDFPTHHMEHILEFDVTRDQAYRHMGTANIRVRASMVMAWP